MIRGTLTSWTPSATTSRVSAWAMDSTASTGPTERRVDKQDTVVCIGDNNALSEQSQAGIYTQGLTISAARVYNITFITLL